MDVIRSVNEQTRPPMLLECCRFRRRLGVAGASAVPGLLVAVLDVEKAKSDGAVTSASAG